jgi:hypothetical protein
MGAAASVASSVASTVASAASTVTSGVRSALSAIGGIFFKRQPDVAPGAADAPLMREQLGPGHALDGGVKSGVESAFGRDFSGVRVHTDSQAASLAGGLHARAFTVGEDVAFGAGEYQPGTPVGDALIAHELAHVAQQAGGTGAQRKGLHEADTGALEDDADQAAVGAVASIWGGAKAGMSDIAREAMPRMRSGLRLQRCPTNKTTTAAGPLTSTEEQAAISHNSGLGYDADTIKSIQGLVGASTGGAFDAATVQKIATWQAGQSLTANGKVDAATLKAMVLALVAASKHDEAIHVIVDAYNLPTTNLARIYWDSSYTAADASTSGTIATGAPQTVVVGPSTWAGSYEHAVKIIGHELQHVQQRTGAVPITNQDIREFLAYAWEALDTTTPALTASERVNHANIAIRYYNRLSTGEKASYVDTYNRLNTLIANRGVGNP